LSVSPGFLESWETTSEVILSDGEARLSGSVDSHSPTPIIPGIEPLEGSIAHGHLLVDVTVDKTLSEMFEDQDGLALLAISEPTVRPATPAPTTTTP
jgi:hypothetical protein